MSPSSDFNNPRGLVEFVVAYALKNPFIVGILFFGLMAWGALVAPFGWKISGAQSATGLASPVAVDAIPDIGENQQIVFTPWAGHSPQDVEDQVTYPLTVSLMGLSGVKSIRSFSMMGFSTIYIIFDEKIDFYWSRSRILEKLSSLSPTLLPTGTKPSLGPDATALGQVFWYSLEGRNKNGEPSGDWNLEELRSIQDWQMRYALLSVEGVAEVASIGGYEKEYQVDLDAEAMKNYDISLEEVYSAVKNANSDVGVRTLEINKVEYVLRGLGLIRNLEDLENTLIKTRGFAPLLLKDIAQVHLGPAVRRGALDVEGSPAVGGVVVARFGANPLAVLEAIKKKLAEIAPSLPERVMEDGTVSKVTPVPFYDRSKLIYETLGTLQSAIGQQMLITLIVVLLMIFHFRGAMMVGAIMPVVVLITFIGMKVFSVDANIVALSGIAIAIGTVVDIGMVLFESVLRHQEEDTKNLCAQELCFNAFAEVGSAVFTAVATTVVSFLPVFAMEAAEGKLFRPLACTKTLALMSSIFVGFALLPPLVALILKKKKPRHWTAFFSLFFNVLFCVLAVSSDFPLILVVLLALLSLLDLLRMIVGELVSPKSMEFLKVLLVSLFSCVALGYYWLPLGPQKGAFMNVFFVFLVVGGFLVLFEIFRRAYGHILKLCLNYKTPFLFLIALTVFGGLMAWVGFEPCLGWLPNSIKSNPRIAQLAHAFPGLGQAFMPNLDEGSFLYMPTTSTHASLGEVMDTLQKMDRAIASIAEVESVAGKLGRVESPLDPAPISMIESIINYKSEFMSDEKGRLLSFAWDEEKQDFKRDKEGQLIADPEGHPFRQWREHIHSPQDIWDEIIKVSKVTGSTTAPKLQPIAARVVMLQSGMRAPMGIKIKGSSLESLEEAGLLLEKVLKKIPAVNKDTVVADRTQAKPYLEMEVDRAAASRYGLFVEAVQNAMEAAVGGLHVTDTLEGRERYGVRIRYQREQRNDLESLERVLIPTPMGQPVPLTQVARFRYVRGPQMIKSEDTFLTSYLLFDKNVGFSEVDTVEACKARLEQLKKTGELKLPEGVHYTFAGNYENQQRAQARFYLVLPLALFFIFILLYLQFRSITTSLLVFSGVAVAWAGGFWMLWLYGQPNFLNFDAFGQNWQKLFQVHEIELTVAVWVGFLALFGVATDDGVILSTLIRQEYDRVKPTTVQAFREATLSAGLRRIRPCLMTSATTILALLPVLTSGGRGADVMIPMAIPSFGGMTVVLASVFVVPVLQCGLEEMKLFFTKSPAEK